MDKYIVSNLKKYKVTIRYNKRIIKKNLRIRETNGIKSKQNRYRKGFKKET